MELKEKMKSEITVQNETIPYRIIRSKRKTLSIEITLQGEVLVRIPMGSKMEDVQRLVESKGSWIQKKRAEMLSKKQVEEKRYEDGTTLYYLGDAIQLKIERQNKNTMSIQVIDKQMLLRLPESFNGSIKPILEEWYYKEAAKEIGVRVSKYATRIGVCYQRITLKDQKTRWGSCSSRGNLNFNYRLIMAPPEVIDYVVVHELCHLLHMNHSSLFWGAVEAVMPNYTKYRDWLKQHGSQLSI